jgi:hypothetical protein
LIANEIVATMPSDANAIALFPVCDAIAEGIDATGDFMARDPRVLQPWPQTIFH